MDRRIGHFPNYGAATGWAQTLAMEHREDVHVRRDGEGWGLFVAEEVAALFGGWQERHDVAGSYPLPSDPRWSEGEQIGDSPDPEPFPDGTEGEFRW